MALKGRLGLDVACRAVGRHRGCLVAASQQHLPATRRFSSSVGLGWGASANAVSESSGRWCPDRLRSEAARLLRSQDPNAEDVGFEVKVAPSGIPNSGMGVFLEGSNNSVVKEGTVVALYSGVYFPLVPLHARAAAHGEVVKDVLRLAEIWGYGAVEDSLQDATFEEAGGYWLILQVYSGVMDGFRAESRVDCGSPFAVGQMVNHPQLGTAPNVDWQEFQWPQDSQEAGDGKGGQRLPNRLHDGLWYIDPVSQEAVNMPRRDSPVAMPLPGVALVALRDIHPGEELFMNYRFNPPYPAWYKPVPA